MITWRRLTEDDFPLLISWLERPHVARWWNHETSVEAVRRDFGPAVRGEEPSEEPLAHLDGGPCVPVPGPAADRASWRVPERPGSCGSPRGRWADGRCAIPAAP
ncbi:GNAT family N-acetyltransferase [Streptomyces sp. DSS69]|uniref:GNAT family N-acetyltransferase n=1 Tax=Streptomyces sp. DSS69 TaxID=3113369 RepID=UPI0031F9B8C4